MTVSEIHSSDGEPAGKMDLARAEQSMRDFLTALGLELSSEGLRDTPGRVTRAYAELLTPVEFSPTTFADDNDFKGLIQVHDIRFVSVCEHHLFPFIGHASVGYVPTGRLLGLSKLARAVEYFAARPQVQERLTAQIGNWLVDKTQSPNVGVIMSAEHSCMSLRGVRSAGAWTTTSDLRGSLGEDSQFNREFLRHTKAC